MAANIERIELLNRLIEQLSKELQALIESGDNFRLTVNVSPVRNDASLEIQKTVKLN